MGKMGVGEGECPDKGEEEGKEKRISEENVRPVTAVLFSSDFCPLEV